jgi:mannose-6-phosphate isomerase-like protein (cupin superfamily)
MTTAVEAESPYKKIVVRPQLLESGKMSVQGANSSALHFSIQIVANGGETNLHAHADIDSVWYVINGGATFYGLEDKVIASLGRHEALFIPHGAPYWFESTPGSAENLIVLHFSAKVPNAEGGRIDYDERKFVIHEPGQDVKAQIREGKTERKPVVMSGKYFEA